MPISIDERPAAIKNTPACSLDWCTASAQDADRALARYSSLRFMAELLWPTRVWQGVQDVATTQIIRLLRHVAYSH